jgi:hypothetical protein
VLQKFQDSQSMSLNVGRKWKTCAYKSPLQNLGNCFQRTYSSTLRWFDIKQQRFNFTVQSETKEYPVCSNEYRQLGLPLAVLQLLHLIIYTFIVLYIVFRKTEHLVDQPAFSYSLQFCTSHKANYKRRFNYISPSILYWKMPSSGVWRCATLVITDVSEDYILSIISWKQS